MSQEMKRALDLNNLMSKQYSQKNSVKKAVKAANVEAKQEMNNVRNLFNVQLARVY